MTDDAYVGKDWGAPWPLDPARPLAFFGSHDGETWERAATAVPDGPNSWKAEPTTAAYRFMKMDYDDSPPLGQPAPQK